MRLVHRQTALINNEKQELSAINFLKNGLSVKQVANGTGLTLEEVEALRNQNFS